MNNTLKLTDSEIEVHAEMNAADHAELQAWIDARESAPTDSDFEAMWEAEMIRRESDNAA